MTVRGIRIRDIGTWWSFLMLTHFQSPMTFAQATSAKLKNIQQKYKWLRFLGYINSKQLGNFHPTVGGVTDPMSPLVRGAFMRYQSAEERQNLKSISTIEPGSIQSLLRPSRADLDEVGRLSSRSAFSLGTSNSGGGGGDDDDDDRDGKIELFSLRKSSRSHLDPVALEAVLEDVVVEESDDTNKEMESGNGEAQVHNGEEKEYQKQTKDLDEKDVLEESHAVESVPAEMRVTQQKESNQLSEKKKFVMTAAPTAFAVLGGLSRAGSSRRDRSRSTDSKGRRGSAATTELASTIEGITLSMLIDSGVGSSRRGIDEKMPNKHLNGNQLRVDAKLEPRLEAVLLRKLKDVRRLAVTASQINKRITMHEKEIISTNLLSRVSDKTKLRTIFNAWKFSVGAFATNADDDEDDVDDPWYKILFNAMFGIFFGTAIIFLFADPLVDRIVVLGALVGIPVSDSHLICMCALDNQQSLLGCRTLF